MSIPYARSLPFVTTNNVKRVPGNPKIKLTTFQRIPPFACACIPVKLKLAKIQIAETPPCVPADADEGASIELAMEANEISPIHKEHHRYVHLLSDICRQPF
jgi:hypothetical protein